MKVYLYLLNTLSDWEIGYLTAELNTGRFFKEKNIPISIIKLSNTLEPKKTMGGFEIKPDELIENVAFKAKDILILPGADTWIDAKNEKILKMIENLLAQNVTIAAICGATIALANIGVLNCRQHTSNDKDYLKAVCPKYSGSSFYENKPAVTDNNLITASGLAPLEFSYEVFLKSGLFKKETLEAWYNLHSTKNPKYFSDLMASIQ
jgi:putative intracellular protease/amidase